MRLIIYGVGAIGGTVAAGLTRAGREVIGIARGARLQALQDRGLHFRTPLLEDRVRFPLVEDPSQIEFRPDDAVMLALKTQHVEPALERLRAAKDKSEFDQFMDERAEAAKADPTPSQG